MSNKPEIPPPPAPVETRIVFAPIDGALLDCLPKPAAAEALGLVEAVKASDAPPQKKAALIIGILNTMLFRYDLSDTDCRSRVHAIRDIQGKAAPAP